MIGICHKRTRPTTMTTIVICAPMAPLALAHDIGREFCALTVIAVIGGLLLFTLLFLLSLPPSSSFWKSWKTVSGAVSRRSSIGKAEDDFRGTSRRNCRIFRDGSVSYHWLYSPRKGPAALRIATPISEAPDRGRCLTSHLCAGTFTGTFNGYPTASTVRPCKVRRLARTLFFN
ncbi:hypothetical protein FE840_019690 (plasmid) [Peteryoungia desertarenae]|uniref:Uncharacterized protein n=2 Tax=Peteryoungia desertarenae TaxID=1813451 RepID=A0ABX6QTB5_9HYPH|nr:hypothetical protein FE840_019690 [Peteryoungia desertarenae]